MFRIAFESEKEYKPNDYPGSHEFYSISAAYSHETLYFVRIIPMMWGSEVMVSSSTCVFDGYFLTGPAAYVQYLIETTSS